MKTSAFSTFNLLRPSVHVFSCLPIPRHSQILECILSPFSAKIQPLPPQISLPYYGKTQHSRNLFSPLKLPKKSVPLCPLDISCNLSPTQKISNPYKQSALWKFLHLSTTTALLPTTPFLTKSSFFGPN